jgi:prenyl protein peptidase
MAHAGLRHDVAPFAISSSAAWLTSALFAGLYVGSLYIWPGALRADRDAPETIKRRFISVLGSSVIAPTVLFSLYFAPPTGLSKHERIYLFLEWLGVRWSGLGIALVAPLGLTATFFAGPLLVLLVRGKLAPQYRLQRLAIKLNCLHWWRNIVIGPLSEEIVFRSCVCSLLVAAGTSIWRICLVSPLLFGAAHLHHVLAVRARGGSRQQLVHAWKQALFQLTYTSLFGAYSAFIFLRTGHLLAAFLCHSFCNAMGFPNLSVLQTHPQRLLLRLGFIFGPLAFILLLLPVTSPSMYSSPFFA